MNEVGTKCRFDDEEGQRMSRAHSPVVVKARPDVSVHDAALDEPPEEINFAVRERQRGVLSGRGIIVAGVLHCLSGAGKTQAWTGNGMTRSSSPGTVGIISRIR